MCNRSKSKRLLQRLRSHINSNGLYTGSRQNIEDHEVPWLGLRRALCPVQAFQDREAACVKVVAGKVQAVLQEILHLALVHYRTVVHQ